MKRNKLINLVCASMMAISCVGVTAALSDTHPVYASSNLKRAYIPKRFRGNWYWNGHKLHISANTINGFGIIPNHDKAYYGTGSDVSSQTRHKLLIHPKGKKLEMILNNSGGVVTLKINKRHGHKSLQMLEGPSYIHYYRSKAISKICKNH